MKFSEFGPQHGAAAAKIPQQDWPQKSEDDQSLRGAYGRAEDHRRQDG